MWKTPCRFAPWVVVACLAIAAGGCGHSHRQDRLNARKAHKTPPRPTEARARSADEITADLIFVRQDLASLFPTFDSVFDRTTRQAAAPRAIPAIRRLIALGREIADSWDFGGGLGFSEEEWLYLTSLLCVLGDPEFTMRLDRMAGSGDPAERSDAEAVRVVMDWFRTGRDPDARASVIIELSQFVAQDPASASGTATRLIAGTTRPDEPQVRQALARIWQEQLQSDPEPLQRVFAAADQRYHASQMRAATTRPLP